MPSVTQHLGFVPPKKRRRGDSDDDGGGGGGGGAPFFQHSYREPLPPPSPPHIVARKIMPLPPAKRLRLSGGGGVDEAAPGLVRLEDGSVQPHHRHRPSPGSHGDPPRRGSPRSPSAKELQQTSGNSRPAAILSPCHICRRRPTKKSDLDAFADCEGCGQRTCYVCIRQCLGWHHGGRGGRERRGGRRAGDERQGDGEDHDMVKDQSQSLSASCHMEDAPDENDVDDPAHNDCRRPGDDFQGGETGSVWGQKGSQKTEQSWAAGESGRHRQTVCSRCCVERGPDGDVVCLGCLSFLEG